MSFNIFDDHVPLEVFGVYRDSPDPFALDLNGRSLKVRQGSGHTYGTGALLWSAAVLLAHVVPQYVREGQAVVELGAGLGLPAVQAALGGARVTLTDLLSCFPVTADNLKANGFAMANGAAGLWARARHSRFMGRHNVN